MLSATDYHFARCKVMGQAREVWLDGQLQHVPPRAFDLLLYLLKHRERVVSKDEILQEIWLGRSVTDNVVSRAIMIVRSVIGDLKDDPVLIKTVQRVGYRFIGELLDDEGRSLREPSATRKSTPRSRAIRLALLPLENLTGQPELAWGELGLPTLVTQSIGANPGLEVIATSAVLTALDDRPLNLSRAELAKHVLQGLGATFLVETNLKRRQHGYALEYLAHGKDALGLAGVLQGAQVTELAQALARAIRRHLFGEKGNIVPFESADPFVSECFSRGMQALNQQEFGKAVDLLRVVRTLEPENTGLGLTYLAALGAAGHEETVKLAEQMIERGRATGDSYLENSARKILARALLEDRRDSASANRVLDRILAAAAPEPMQSWYIEALMMRARIQLDQGERRAPRELLASALALCDQTDNQILRSWALNNRATLEAREGQLWQARETFREVHHLLVRMQRPADCARTQSNLAITNFHLGLIDEAVSEMDSAVLGLQQIAAVPQKIPNSIMSAALVYANVHDVQKIDQLLESLRHGAWSATVASSSFVPHVVGAYRAYGDADVQASAELFGRAIEIVRAQGQIRKLQSWLPMSVMHLTLAGRYDDAHAAAALFDTEVERSFPWARSVMLHASAIEALQCGDRLRARQLLLAALKISHGGWTQAMIRIDLAWMYLCNDELDAARSLCTSIEPFLTQHPAGLLVHALLESRAGRPDGALRALRAHLEMVGGASRSSFAGLLKQASASDAASRRLDVSALLQFPTSYLVLKAHPISTLEADREDESQADRNEEMSK